MRWRVQNEFGADGLPIEQWAAIARSRLIAQAVVEHAHIEPTRESDPDDIEFEVLDVDVVLEAPDDITATAIVEQAVMSALWDAVGDREIGWTQSPWEATPARPD